MSDHTNKQFDAEMEAIRSGVLSMGGIVETAAGARDRGAREATTTRDLHRCRRRGRAADQPAAGHDRPAMRADHREAPADRVDLRMVLTVTKIVNDLERIGDEVKKIAYKAAQTRGSDRLARVRYLRHRTSRSTTR